MQPPVAPQPPAAVTTAVDALQVATVTPCRGHSCNAAISPSHAATVRMSPISAGWWAYPGGPERLSRDLQAAVTRVPACRQAHLVAAAQAPVLRLPGARAGSQATGSQSDCTDAADPQPRPGTLDEVAPPPPPCRRQASCMVSYHSERFTHMAALAPGWSLRPLLASAGSARAWLSCMPSMDQECKLSLPIWPGTPARVMFGLPAKRVATPITARRVQIVFTSHAPMAAIVVVRVLGAAGRGLPPAQRFPPCMRLRLRHTGCREANGDLHWRATTSLGLPWPLRGGASAHSCHGAGEEPCLRHVLLHVAWLALFAADGSGEQTRAAASKEEGGGGGRRSLHAALGLPGVL